MAPSKVRVQKFSDNSADLLALLIPNQGCSEKQHGQGLTRAMMGTRGAVDPKVKGKNESVKEVMIQEAPGRWRMRPFNVLAA